MLHVCHVMYYVTSMWKIYAACVWRNWRTTPIWSTCVAPEEPVGPRSATFYSNRSFCPFPTSFVGHWNPEIVCCVYFHPSRLVEIPRGLNLGNISHVSLKNPTSATLLTCSSYSLTDPERNCWRLKFENALSIPPMTNQPSKFWENKLLKGISTFWEIFQISN